MPNGYNAQRRNALQRGAGSFRSQVRAATDRLQASLVSMSDPNAPEVREAGAVLAKRMRKTLGKRYAELTPARTIRDRKKKTTFPKRESASVGGPPGVQARRLAGSVGQAVIGGVRRVGAGYFTAQLMEDGVDAAPKLAVAKGTVIQGKTRKFRSRGRKARKGHHMAPHPWAEASLAAALPDMTNAYADVAARRFIAGEAR